MTSQSPRIYLYRITFEEVPYYYYGVKKEKYFNQEYWGTPITHKWCWELYTPKKQILQVFPYTDEGWIEAQEIEKRLINPVYQTDKWCLNENCGGIISLNTKRKTGSKVGKKMYENKLGIHNRTKEQMSEDGKKGGKIGGKKSYELRLGFHSQDIEQRIRNNKKAGEKAHKLKLGVHNRTEEQMSKDGKKGGNKIYELGLGIHSFSKEQRSENGKKTNSQRWMCTETEYISTPGGLSNYQKKRGIDTSKRVRIS